MKTFPSKQELLERYREVLSNETVTAVSNWRQSNTDSPTDERAYRDRGLEIASLIKRTFGRTIKDVRHYDAVAAKS